MRHLILSLSAALSLMATPALADPSAAELAAAREAETRGAEIYAYDQAAWHSTDQLQADLKARGLTLEQISAQGMAGYIVEPAGDGVLLATYYGAKDGKTFAMARYWVRGSKVERGGMLAPGDDAALSPLARKLIETRSKAMEAARAENIFLCSRGAPNTVVLAPRADGSIPAYVMSSSVEHGQFPAGGHYRYVFGADGKLASSRAFTKSCVSVAYGDPSDKSKTAVGAGVSHLMDPQPTEIHVFVSYNVPIPLFVIISSNGSMWEVNRGKVSSPKR
ncbi:MAG: hypothetical protein J0M19_13170 [Sphingomonadales bacterium]|nr:hypothetical protein [Sphingomonadales bacterium]